MGMLNLDMLGVKDMHKRDWTLKNWKDVESAAVDLCLLSVSFLIWKDQGFELARAGDALVFVRRGGQRALRLRRALHTSIPAAPAHNEPPTMPAPMPRPSFSAAAAHAAAAQAEFNEKKWVWVPDEREGYLAC